MAGEQNIKKLISNHVTFREGARVLLSGTSGSGKSHFISQVIEHRNDLFEVAPQRIIFCTHSMTQDLHLGPTLLDELNDKGKKLIEFRNTIPTDEEEETFEENTMLVFDDFLSGADVDFQAGLAMPFMTRRCHHEKLYLFITTQNLYIASKNFRLLSQNANYLIIFKSHRSLHQLRYMGQQILGAGNSNLLINIFKRATKDRQFAYLFYDMHPLTDDRIRFQTNLFKEKEPYVVVYEILE
jgi:energy-coupling factor transporter ATP-binding protein EcfA2